MTLVELMVVFGLIGILITTLATATNFNTQIKRSRDAVRKNDLKQLQNALELYYDDNGAYPIPALSAGALWSSSEVGETTCPQAQYGGTNWIPGIASSYIRQLPHDPKGGNSTIPGGCSSNPCKSAYWYRSDDGQSYAILANCSPEISGWNSSDPYYDSLRPTWAWKVCGGPSGCSY